MRYTGTGTGTIGCGEYTDPNYFPDHKNDIISTDRKFKYKSKKYP